MHSKTQDVIISAEHLAGSIQVGNRLFYATQLSKEDITIHQHSKELNYCVSHGKWKSAWYSSLGDALEVLVNYLENTR